MQKKCMSCNKIITNDTSATSFPCPSCGKEEMIRCSKCRKTGVNYTCKCKFEGP